MTYRLLATVAVTALVIAGCSSSEPEAGEGTNTLVTTTMAQTPTSTTAPASVAPDEVSAVMAAIDVWNAGDFEGWLAHLVPDPDEDHLFSRSLMNANQQIEVTRPCIIGAVSAEGTTVECAISVDDDFHGAGGVVSSGLMEFIVNDVGLVVDLSDNLFEDPPGNCCPQWQAFTSAFHRWLMEAYPDVYDEIGPQDGTPLWFLPGVASGNPDHMFIALEYVDEFVADSDKYPSSAADG